TSGMTLDRVGLLAGVGRNVVVAGINLPSNQERLLRADASVKFVNPTPGIFAITARIASLPQAPYASVVDNFAVETSLKEVIGRVELEPGVPPASLALSVLGLFGMNRRGVTSDALAELNRLPESLRKS